MAPGGPCSDADNADQHVGSFGHVVQIKRPRRGHVAVAAARDVRHIELRIKLQECFSKWYRGQRGFVFAFWEHGGELLEGFDL